MRKKICQKCGAAFFGTKDNLYCENCAKEIKSDVMRMRACKDCGAEFLGGPRALRCPECRKKAQKEVAARCKRNGPARKLGSIDYCERCGQPYTVTSGRQKYCSDTCMRSSVLEWQREHKKGYSSISGQEEKRKERREKSQKVCLYCGRPFVSHTVSVYCSEYCKKEQKRIQQYLAEIRRGVNCDIDRLYRQREKYREDVKSQIRMKENTNE